MGIMLEPYHELTPCSLTLEWSSGEAPVVGRESELDVATTRRHSMWTLDGSCSSDAQIIMDTLGSTLRGMLNTHALHMARRKFSQSETLSSLNLQSRSKYYI